MSPYRVLVVDRKGNEIILTAAFSRDRVNEEREVYIQERINNVKTGQLSLFDRELSPKQIAHRYASPNNAILRAKYFVVSSEDGREYILLNDKHNTLYDKGMPILQDCLHLAIKHYLKNNKLKLREEL